ncbi:TetR/AcrR family transcriptional regulator [Pseudooceanicola sp. CBS1P-1]|uniref:TetR family transcriptional regulator n=1 Tax=Pseudooceanicola albus TaxID=2692189 RepID=A0A6L7FZQ8_9RHOB|nr:MULTISPECIES: TetR/AcrR family transcriptional regulator [Pseudooceanicola]MBT9384001.1 TetR/AcrR family transcriptional regulator [Pseudooceanicola endophyticus]MXN16587.1 TetR family transcriptional regulator [Pseudooceanicola albus]
MTEDKADPTREGRVARRQKRNRAALIRAASDVMSEKGIDAATMLEIADRADMGAGTVYNYFRSKDELAVAVLEEIMQDLALRVEQAGEEIDDPAQVYAMMLACVLETAISDPRWRQLLERSGIVADAMAQRIGPFAIDLLKRGGARGRFWSGDARLSWQMTTHAIVGVALSALRAGAAPESLPAATLRLLCLAGLSRQDAAELLARPRPDLPPEEALRSLEAER